MHAYTALCVTVKEILMHVHGVAVKCRHKGKLKQTHTLFFVLFIFHRKEKLRVTQFISDIAF